MTRPTVARVELGAVRSNLRVLQAFLGGRAGVIAVVKANAYGHGAGEVGLALEEAGAALLACADIEEGVVLRAAGVTIPILVFGALSVSDLDGVFNHALTPTISTPSAARALEAAAARHGRTPRVPPQDRHRHEPPRVPSRQPGADHAPRSRRAAICRIAAVYTHFATADDPEHPLFDLQRERFEAALAALPSLGIDARVAPRGELRGDPARRTRLVRLRAARPAPVRNRPAAAGARRCR